MVSCRMVYMGAKGVAATQHSQTNTARQPDRQPARQLACQAAGRNTTAE